MLGEWQKVTYYTTCLLLFDKNLAEMQTHHGEK